MVIMVTICLSFHFITMTPLLSWPTISTFCTLQFFMLTEYVSVQSWRVPTTFTPNPPCNATKYGKLSFHSVTHQCKYSMQPHSMVPTKKCRNSVISSRLSNVIVCPNMQVYRQADRFRKTFLCGFLYNSHQHIEFQWMYFLPSHQLPISNLWSEFHKQNFACIASRWRQDPQNVGILHHYTVSQPRRQYESLYVLFSIPICLSHNQINNLFIQTFYRQTLFIFTHGPLLSVKGIFAGK
jgi:hypothetical protein